MNVTDVQNAIIRRIKAHTGRPIIQADQGGEIPDEPHVVFKFIVPYSKGTGRPIIDNEMALNEYRQTQTETYNMTLSLTAVAADGDTASELAQAARDWIDFHGYEEMSAAGIVVASLGDIGNRDSVNDDETREGFDAIFRVNRTITRVTTYIETVDVTPAE